MKNKYSLKKTDVGGTLVYGVMKNKKAICICYSRADATMVRNALNGTIPTESEV